MFRPDHSRAGVQSSEQKRGLDNQSPVSIFPKKKPLIFKGLLRYIALSETREDLPFDRSLTPNSLLNFTALQFKY